MMYYKFNLEINKFRWIGTKACKKKDLKSLNGSVILKIGNTPGGD